MFGGCFKHRLGGEIMRGDPALKALAADADPAAFDQKRNRVREPEGVARRARCVAAHRHRLVGAVERCRVIVEGRKTLRL